MCIACATDACHRKASCIYSVRIYLDACMRIARSHWRVCYQGCTQLNGQVGQAQQLLVQSAVCVHPFAPVFARQLRAQLLLFRSIHPSLHPSIHAYIHTTPPCHPLARSRALSLSLASPPPFPVPLTRPADVRGCEQKVHGLDVGLM